MLKFLMMLLILSLGCIVPLQVQGADGVTEVLENITQQMADLKSVQVDFVQEKKMAIFSAPIVLRGMLSWERRILLPGTLFHLLNMPLSCDKGLPVSGMGNIM